MMYRLHETLSIPLFTLRVIQLVAIESGLCLDYFSYEDFIKGHSSTTHSSFGTSTFDLDKNTDKVEFAFFEFDIFDTESDLSYIYKFRRVTRAVKQVFPYARLIQS